MRHDWIFDVLSDLKAYAIQNDLPALAAKVEEALVLARAEIGEDGGGKAIGQHAAAPGRTH